MESQQSAESSDARGELAGWLRTARSRRKMSVEDVAKVTKIQQRILESLEAGRFDGLPADVFVRGFVRSFARCVGLDESEALERYGACVAQGSTVGACPPPAATPHGGEVRSSVAKPATAAPTPVARALVETMAELAPTSASAGQARIVEAAPVSVEAIGTAPVSEHDSHAVAADLGAPTKRKRAPRKKAATTATAKPRTRRAKGTLPPPDGELVVAPVIGETADAIAEPTLAVVEAIGDAPIEPPAEPSAAIASAPIEVVDRTASPCSDAEDPVVAWAPTMPPIAPSVPWRRPAWSRPVSAAASSPSLVIDDANPDSAEQEQEQRTSAKEHRRSFLPPILLDREDRSARQGGLTLAVIILLIAATLTLSYLMRRPSSGGTGVTMADSSLTLG